MAPQIAELHEALVARRALEGLHIVVHVQVVDEVADLSEGGLALVVLAEHQLVDSVTFRIHLLKFVKLTVVHQVHDFVALVRCRVILQKAHVGFIRHVRSRTLRGALVAAAHLLEQTALLLLLRLFGDQRAKRTVLPRRRHTGRGAV